MSLLDLTRSKDSNVFYPLTSAFFFLNLENTIIVWHEGRIIYNENINTWVPCFEPTLYTDL